MAEFNKAEAERQIADLQERIAVMKGYRKDARVVVLVPDADWENPSRAIPCSTPEKALEFIANFIGGAIVGLRMKKEPCIYWLEALSDQVKALGVCSEGSVGVRVAATDCSRVDAEPADSTVAAGGYLYRTVGKPDDEMVAPGNDAG